MEDLIVMEILGVSVWSAVGEIEFYGNEIVSVDENEFANSTLIYPLPAKDILHLENLNGVNLISVYDMHGREIMDKNISGSALAIDLDVSSIPSGSYVIVLKGEQVYQSKLFVVSR